MKERAHYIDAAKGVAILCITFLHFEEGVIPGWLNAWIGLFMITTFYFTSGWVHGVQNRRITAKELFVKRVKQLGIPYLWFSALIIVFNILWVLLGFMETEILLRDIYKTITLRGIGTLWFLPVLVIGETIFCFIKNSKHKWTFALIGMLMVFVVKYLYYDVWSPMRETSTLHKLIDSPMQPFVRGIAAWPIIASGYIISKYAWQVIAKYRKTLIALIGTIAILFSIALVTCPPFEVHYLNSLLSNTLPVFGFICLFYIIGSKNYFSRFFIYWGINSLILMCTHYSIIEVILKTLDDTFVHSGFKGTVTLIYFIITIMASYPIVMLFNGKLKFMLGKK